MKRLTHTPCLLLCAVLAIAEPSAAIAASPSATSETRHASGIALVGPGPYQPRPANEAQKTAYRGALRAAQDNPDQLGYPWLDAQGHLIQRNTTPKGLKLAQKVDAAIPRRTVPAMRSYKQLEDIKDEIIFLDKAGFVGADAIWKTQPDEEHNRIIVTVNRLDNALMDQLAKIYGTQAIAVHVEPLGLDSGMVRYSDTSPYSGGAAYDPSSGPRCTLGFAFTSGFITAGHCEITSGIAVTIWDFSRKIGTIDETNWHDGTGTVSFPREPGVYRGDISLIKTTSSALQRPRIYIGTSTSGITRNVSSMWWSESVNGERYCTGGSTTGELCDWTVVASRIDYKPNPTEHWLHVTEGYRYGQGVEPGDSGGPVYTYNSDGSISAKGIINARGGTAPGYKGYFTEIIQAYLYFPGYLKTGGKVSLVINNNSDKCLDVQGDSTVNGAAVIQYTCHGGVNQQWYWENVPGTNAVKIVNERGKCLSIDSNSTSNGAKVHQWTCFDNNAGQQWTLKPNGMMVNGYGKCLGIDYNSTASSARVTQWDCIGAPSQYWAWY